MSIEGTLGRQGLAQVLVALARRDRTGILTVQGQTEIIALSFLDGEVVSADALNLTLEDGLGSVLVDLGLLTQDDFAGLAAEHQAGGGRVGELLVERGYVSRLQLLAAIRVHTYRLCRDVLSWAEGDYKFYQGEEVSYEPGLTPIPVPELMVRVGRELGWADAAETRYPEAGSVYARVPEAFEAGLGSRGGEAEPPAVAELGDEARDLFTRLDGSASVTDLAQTTGLQDFVVCYLLYRFERQQIIELVRFEEPAPAPPEPVDPVEMPEAEIEIPSPRPRGPSLLERWRETWLDLPAIGDLLFAWAGRVAGVAMLVWVVFTFATAVAGGGSALDDVEAPPPIHQDLRSRIDLERVHRGAQVFFLLYGRYPDELERLVDLQLRPARSGRRSEPPLDYSATAVSYVVARPSATDGAGSAETGTIAGNFLLDPDFAHGEVSDRPPLVLLD